MSLEDFEKMGLLRDQSEWGSQPVRVNNVGMALAAIVSLLGCVLMVVGNGGWVTGGGIVLFVVGLAGLVTLNLKGVERADDE